MTNPIIKHIPHGQENAIKRSMLVAVTGMSDRKVRDYIEDARHNGYPILNLQDGKGYFIATEADKDCVERQIATNTKRAKAILHPNKFLKRVLDDYPEFDLRN